MFSLNQSVMIAEWLMCLFSVRDSWYCLPHRISDRVTDWPVDPHSLTHSSALRHLNICAYMLYLTWISLFILTKIKFFSLPSLLEHMASIVFWLDPLSLILLFVRQSTKMGERKMGVSARSTRQLRVINHCHHRERRRMKDMRAGAQQTWQKSLCRDEMNQPIQWPLLCCWYEAVTSHPAQERILKRWSQRSRNILVKREGKWTHHALTNKSIWILHWITASLESPKGPQYLVKTAELWIMKIFRLQWERKHI